MIIHWLFISRKVRQRKGEGFVRAQLILHKVCQSFVFTVRIQRITEGNVFTLSTIAGGGEYLPSGQGGAHLPRWGVPTLVGGYLPWQGVPTFPGRGLPTLAVGYLPSQAGGYLPWQGGTYLGRGYLPWQGVPTLVGGTYLAGGYLPWWGVPTFPACTCYAAGGMPVAFT